MIVRLRIQSPSGVVASDNIWLSRDCHDNHYYHKLMLFSDLPPRLTVNVMIDDSLGALLPCSGSPEARVFGFLRWCRTGCATGVMLAA
jgi:hypothetical protein